MAIYGPTIKGVSLKRVFVVYCMVLIAIIAGLKYFDFTQETIKWIGGIGVISGVIMWAVAEILVWLHFWSERPKQPTPKQRTAALGVGYLLGFLVIVALVIIWALRGRLYTPLPEINYTAEFINERVNNLKVEPGPIVFVSPKRTSIFKSFEQAGLATISPELTEQPVYQFVISVKDDPLLPFYLFNVSEYTIETGGDPTLAPTMRVCDFVNEYYDEKSQLLDAISKLPGDLEIKKVIKIPIFKFFAEFIYASKKIHAMSHSKAEILVKGYADGQMNDWKRPLLRGRYEYRDIKMYPIAEPDSMNPFTYIHSEVSHKIDSNYNNNDLPNLRAKFVMEDLIKPFLHNRNCINSQNIETHILQGYEYREIDSVKRKVQIFILLF